MSAPKYLVAIFGGAVSGSEAAHQLAQRGIPSVVFEQNALPYGKIEDGLPKWHVKLRDKEEGKINEKLSHPLVTYVPQTALGTDIDFEDVTQWGFSAILLATGAWKDRPLPIDGIDEFLGKGLVYQNPFIYWYNHNHEPGTHQDEYSIEDNVAIIGGGLASLDVAKVLMFELVQKALEKQGHDTDLFTLDRSIAKVLQSLDLTLDDLGVQGCTLYYRRRVKDMPLVSRPTDTPEQLAKVQAIREKILNNYQSKYLFNVEPNHMPIGKITEDDRLVGLIMQETEVTDGRVKAIPDTEKEIRFPYVVSSIGSIPAMIPGIPVAGQTYHIEDEVFCRLNGYPNVFALGNAVTGRGNIKESMDHGREIAQNVIEGYLPDSDGSPNEEVVTRIQEAIDSLEDEVRDRSLSPGVYNQIMEKVNEHHQRTGYENDYLAWMKSHLPVRLEQLLGVDH